MARNMTTVQKSSTIRFGSAKFEVGETEGNLIDLGAMRGISFEESWDELQVKSDNAGVITAGLTNHMAKIAGELMEINLSKLHVLRGGIDKLENIAASPKTVTGELVKLTGQNQVRLNNKNGAGTVVTAIVVKGQSGSPTHALGTDYTVSVDSSGYTCIARTAAGGIADGATVKVDYTYTPISAVKLLSGGLSTFQPRVVRITNYDDAGKEFRITVYKANSASGLNITFPEADGEDPAMTPIEMTGTNDTSRAVGEQLFEIYDSQGV